MPLFRVLLLRASLLLASLPLIACSAPAAAPEAARLAASTSAAPASPVTVDTTCRTNADCAVKNVGSCCGAMPACVNKDSATDPAGVQAQCRAKGRVSVCGFPQVSACTCQAGQCVSAGGVDPAERVQ